MTKAAASAEPLAACSSPRASTGRPSLARNFSWTLLGNAGYAASQWALVVLITRLGSAEALGRFALALALTSPVILFSRLSLRPIQATDAAGSFRLGHYLALRLAGTGAALVVIGLIAAVYQPELMLLIFCVAAAKAVESAADIFYGFQQQHERMHCVAQSLLLKGPLGVVGMLSGLWLGGSVTWGAAGMLAGWTLPLLLFDLPAVCTTLKQSSVDEDRTGGRRGLCPLWQAGPLWRLAWLALPLGFVQLFSQLNLAVPRYLTEHYLGMASLGVFAAVFYFRVVGMQMITAMGQAVSPRLARLFAREEYTQFRSLLCNMLAGGAAVGGAAAVVCSLAGRPLLALVYGDLYAQHAGVLVLVMIGAAISYLASPLGFALTAMRVFRAQQFVLAAVLASGALACWRLIPVYQLEGAGYASIAAASVYLALNAVLVQFVLSSAERRAATAGCPTKASSGNIPLGNQTAGDETS